VKVYSRFISHLKPDALPNSLQAISACFLLVNTFAFFGSVLTVKPLPEWLQK
jgi:hypothetical protein